MASVKFLEEIAKFYRARSVPLEMQSCQTPEADYDPNMDDDEDEEVSRE